MRKEEMLRGMQNHDLDKTMDTCRNIILKVLMMAMERILILSHLLVEGS